MKNLIDQDFDVLIIGSGPAGVSVAWPLVRAKKKILMLDVGFTKSNNVTKLYNNQDTSPKVRSPELSYVFRDFKKFYNLKTDKFTVNGSLAKGGLSNAWSTLVSSFTDDEFEKFPFDRKDILENYKDVGKRIGISGDKNGDLTDWLGNEYVTQSNLPIHPLIKKILENYESKKSYISNLNIKMGRHHQAILSSKLADRPAFSDRSMFGYLNTDKSAYNSSDEIDKLKIFSNFNYLKNYFVENVLEKENHCIVLTKNISNETVNKFKTKITVLAAGTVGSTKLALNIKKYYNKALILKNTPMYPFAILFPTEIMRQSYYKIFSYWHMSYTLENNEIPKRCKIYGHITPTDGINYNELSARIPLPSPLNKWFAKLLWPKMVLGTCIFTGYFSNNKIILNEKNELRINGNTHEKYFTYVKRSKKILRKTFLKLNGLLLTDSKLPNLGEDSHYACTLPMKKNPQMLETDVNGLLSGEGQVYCVDGAVLTELPAKSHTFTIMANADRISKKILERLINN